MSLPKHYQPSQAEPALDAFWQETGIYHYDPERRAPLYTVDTPPPTVSGYLHLGHVFSYSHTDFMVRFWRMNGHNVFYPMGYDDNGLPTERLVERRTNVKAADVGREAFAQMCLETSEEAEKEYRQLWQRLGLSIDWRYSYRTISDLARRTSQWSFLDLYHKNLAYRKQAPALWCPECQTAIAQAELNPLERETIFYSIAFQLANGAVLPIATTRPELLSACVAIFVHPDDSRHHHLIGQTATVPLFERSVPILADKKVDPETGTGAVMCCTFGDTDDIYWWNTYNLPLIEAMGRDGKLTHTAGQFAGLSPSEARQQIVQTLTETSLLLCQKSTGQIIRVHERCDTPIEYILVPQWFIRVLDFKTQLRVAGEQIEWYPTQMKNRYIEWVENLNWDWCISRQRYFGVPFPVWYCSGCGQVITAAMDELPVDPLARAPSVVCKCGSTSFSPETDVMDTWATSSMTPQITGQFLENPDLYGRVFPMTMRPQSHEIIRTWAFYTIVKSLHHFNKLPWQTIAISGWGLAPEGTGKISKSRGGGPVAPMKVIEDYSADAVRYWAASTSLGKDSVISLEKIQTGAKLVTKLWNVARFAAPFLVNYHPLSDVPAPTVADRWILARLQQVIEYTTVLFRQYDHAAAKSEIEAFFWHDLTDNYLEMAKQRLYNQEAAHHEAAQFTLYQVLLTTLKLFAPFLPYVTEKIYQEVFRVIEGHASIHVATWPTVETRFADASIISLGEVLIEIATAVRRYKSDHQLPLMTTLERLQLATDRAELAQQLQEAATDLASITRATEIEVTARLDTRLTEISRNGKVSMAIESP